MSSKHPGIDHLIIRNIHIIGLCTIVLLFISIIINFAILPTRYKSTATVAIAGTGPLVSGAPDAVVALLKTQEVYELAAEKTGSLMKESQLTPDALMHMINADNGKSPNVFLLSVSNYNPKIATVVANAYADAFVEIISKKYSKYSPDEISTLEKQAERSKSLISRIEKAQASATQSNYLSAEKAEAEDIYRTTLTQLDRARNTPAGGTSASIVARAVEPTEPVSPKRKRNILLSGAVGLLMGLLLSFIREQRTNS